MKYQVQARVTAIVSYIVSADEGDTEDEAIGSAKLCIPRKGVLAMNAVAQDVQWHISEGALDVREVEPIDDTTDANTRISEAVAQNAERALKERMSRALSESSKLYWGVKP